MGNYTFYLDKMRMEVQQLFQLKSTLKRCFGVLSFLLLTIAASAQSKDVQTALSQADANANNAAFLLCGLSLDHIDLRCADEFTGEITINLSTNESGIFMINWVSGPQAIPATTYEVLAGDIDPVSGLFQGDIYNTMDATGTGLVDGVYSLEVTTPSEDVCFAQATIFVTDFQDPEIICPPDETVPIPPGECEVVVIPSGAIATDSCGVMVTVDIEELTLAAGESQDVVFTATDSNGNTASCTTTYTAEDNEPPVPSCPSTVNVTTDDANCDATATWEITGTDNCGVESITATCIYPDGTEAPCASGEQYPIGTTIVAGTVTDVNGNSANCNFQIIVEDGEDPVVNCPADIVASCDGGCGANVPFDLTATDNCGVVSESSSHNSGDFFPVGTTTVTYTATDAAGNSATCTFDVTVVDDKPPVLECPADVTMTTSASGDTYDCEATVPDFIPALVAGTDGSFSDNCDATPSQSPAPGTAWGGSHNSTQDVIITVTDDAGNSTTCSVTLTLVDDEDPTIDCPDDITLSAGANCDAVATWPDPPTADNCGVASVTSTHNSGDTFGEGTTTIEYTVTDVAGNTATCNFTVTVVNDTPPSPVCNATNVNVTIDADANCEAVHTWTDPILTDNCDNEFPTSPTCTFPDGTTGACASGDSFPLGTTNVNYADAAICDFTITVVDNTPPTVDPQDVTEATGDNGIYDCDMLVPNYQDPIVDGAANPLYNATDNCDVTVTQDPAPGTVVTSNGVCEGPVTVTVTATDSAGNSDSGTATVTLNDDVDPLITCPADITVMPGDGDCDGEEVTIPVPVYVPPTVDPVTGEPIAPTHPTDDPTNGAYTDDCDCVDLSGPFTDVALDASNTGTFPIGTTTVSYIATDEAGNTAECTFTVTVLPPNPVIICNGSDTSSATVDADANCEATHEWPTPTLEACDVSTPLSATCEYPDGSTGACASGDTFPLGTTQITYPDAPQCNLSVTVVDNTPPTVDPQDVTEATGDNNFYDCDVVIPNYEDEFIGGAANPLYTGADNCDVTVTQDPAPGTVFDDGGVCNAPITVTVTATDTEGNSAVGTATVTLNDNVDPLITCPADLTATGTCDGAEVTIPVPVFVQPTVDPATGEPSAPMNPDNPATGAYTDDCDCVVLSGPTTDNGVTLDANNTGTFPIGTTTLTYTATDAAGNTATCTFVVTVGTPDPVIVCNGSDTSSATLDANDNCEAVHNWPSPTLEACDDSTPLSATCEYPDGTSGACASGDTFPLGITQITYPTAPQCNLSVTVVDNDPPTVDPQDVTEATSENGVYDCDVVIPNYEDEFIDGAANPLYTGADNCDVTVTQDPAPGTVFDDGGVCNDPITVTVTATDSAGNSAVGTATVTLNDDVDPLITCPDDLTATGTCDGAVVTIPVPVYVPPTLDGDGNPIAPENPDDPSTGAYTDDCNCVTLSGPTTDNGVTLDANNTGTFPIGTTTLTYTATDAAGNTATCTFVVTVGTPDPVIVCNGSDTSSATLDANDNCEAVHNWPSPTLEACDDSTPLSATCEYPDGTTGACASGDTFPLGTTQITYPTAPQCNLSVTVVDNDPPTVDPQDVAEATSENGVYDCDVVIPNYEDEFIGGAANPLYTGADNCDVTVTQDPAPGTVFDDGGVCNDPITVTVTATDSAGNSAVGTATVTLNDDVDPLITCPADVNIVGACEGAEVTIPVPVYVEPTLDGDGNPIAPTNPDDASTGAYTDDCDCVVLSGPTNDNGVTLDANNTGTFPVGTTTLTYTATDAAGNTATCTFTVTVGDPDPVIVCNGSDDASATYEANENCEAPHTWPSPTLEACDASTPIPATCEYPDGTSAPCASGDMFPLGTTTVTFANAGAGDIPDCTFTVTVEDTPPTFNAEDAVIPTSDNDVYDCGVAVPNYVDPASEYWINLEDNCGAVATQDPAPGTVFGTCHEDTQDVVITIYDDVDGDGVPDNDTPVGTQTVTVTLIDDVDPLIVCPPNVVIETENCDGADYTALPFNLVEETLDADGNPLPLDPYTYADDCSTADDCLTTGFMIDNDVVLSDGDSGSATFPGGTTTLTYTVTDGAGNTATCTYTVTVIILEDYTINCPSNIKLPNDMGECGADVVWNAPVVIGTCGGAGAGNAPPTSCVYPDGTTGPCGSGDFFPVGVTTVSYEGTDCSFEVRILDTEKPVIDCPADIEVSVAGQGCKVIVEWDHPGATDNCGVISMNGTHTSGNFFPVGTTTVIYKATDAAGNAASCNFDIIVIDNLPPEASCPADIVLDAEGTSGGATATWTPPNPVDNCVASGVAVITSHEPGAFFEIGTTTVTYILEDADGNMDECSFTVTVNGAAAAAPRIAATVALEGSMMNSSNGLMRDDLRKYPTQISSMGIVTPYSVDNAAIGTSVLADPISSADMPNSVMAWIMLEVRDAADPTQIVASKSALVQRDGDIVGTDGVSAVSFYGLSNGNYYVAVRHRNHLGVMTATPVYLDANTPTLDFTDTNFNTWGTNAQVNINGKMSMIAGDSTGDGAVTAADRADVWNNRNTQGYMSEDCDMNGAVTASDRSVTYNNRNTVEQLPQ